MAKNATQTSKPAATPTACGCRCGADTNKGRTFRPGHDARLVSLVTRDVVNGDLAYTHQVLPDLNVELTDDIQSKIDNVAKAIETRFSTKLADKAHAALMNAWNREAKDTPKARKASKAAAAPKVQETKPVKIGRWTYPTRIVDGTVERNSKTDGSGEWIPFEK